MKLRILLMIIIPIAVLSFWYYELHSRNSSYLFKNSTWLSGHLPEIPDSDDIREKNTENDDASVVNIKPQYNEWKQCMLDKLAQVSNDSIEFWDSWYKNIIVCEDVFSKYMDIRGFRNKDEMKYHILPLSEENSTIITIGIGHDTEAEKKLHQALGASATFYGADPIVDGNEAIYSQFGSFFNFAISGESGILEMSILGNHGYYNKKVPTISLVYFIKEILQVETIVDTIWIDSEGAEYSMLDHFYRDGPLDKNGITICQFNIEASAIGLIHQPTDARKKQVYNFVWHVLKDEKYVFFKPLIQGGHLRLYFVNVEDNRCKKKYILPPK